MFFIVIYACIHNSKTPLVNKLQRITIINIFWPTELCNISVYDKEQGAENVAFFPEYLISNTIADLLTNPEVANKKKMKYYFK